MTHARTDYKLVLGDGTELWIDRSSTPTRTKPRITEISPTESLVLKVSESLKDLKGAPLLDLSKATQDELDLITLYAGAGTVLTPQFRRDEMINFVYINPKDGKRSILATLSTVSVIRK